MHMCPFCDKVYDESEYSHCPYCSGELDDDDEEEVRPCTECGGCLHWGGEIWECSNCDYTEEDYKLRFFVNSGGVKIPLPLLNT